MPLHTKYRPKTLDDFVGNEALVSSLRSVLREDDPQHTFLITGPAGCGKCVVKDTHIITENGIECIGDYKQKVDGTIPLITKIQSVDKQEKTSHFFQETAQITYEVTNNLGLKIEGTPEHPILILNEEGLFQFKELTNLCEGDIACINREMDFYPKNNFKIDFQYEKKSHDANSIDLKNIPKKMDIRLARLLGYITANGSEDSNKIKLATKNKKIIEDIKQIISHYNQHIGKIYNGVDFNIGGIQLKSFILYLLEEDRIPKSRNKTVPRGVLQSKKEIHVNFLRSLFDCDSYMNKTNTGLQYYTANYVLAKQVSIMLLNLGIISSLTSKYLEEQNHTYYTVNIYGENIDIYFKEIGSLKYTHKKMKRNTNNDTIPHLREHIESKIGQLRNRLKVKGNGTYSLSGKTKLFSIGQILHDSPSNKKASYKWALKTKKFLKEANLNFPEVNDSIDKIEYLTKDEFYYSPITEIKKIEKQKKVYDFVIPTTHSFFSNGYISHNTTLARIIKEELKCSDMDFYHINAANVRGIDSARTILENMSLYPMNGKVKIYHYEESHQLTTPTQELLLDETEEPPDFVYFIFCTTEPDKLKKSFKRRGWQGETQKLVKNEMTSLIKSVLNKEIEDANEFPKEVIDKIILSSDGSAGQALKLLDSVIDMEDLSQAIVMIDTSVKEEASIIDVCRLLANQNKSGESKWKALQTLLTNIDTEPEVIRKAVLTYLGKVMLNNSSSVISETIKLFSSSFMYSYKAGLINACYLSCKLK